MKFVRTLTVLAVALTLSAGMAFAQSLAEIAKKEKERRQENKTTSKKVITDRELTRGYGGLPTTRQTSTGAESDEDGAPASGEDAGEEEAEDETKTQAYWQNRASGAKEKIAKLESELEDGDWGEGQKFGVDPLGQNNLARRADTEQQLQAARSELEAIRAEARRAGVPPGWVR